MRRMKFTAMYDHTFATGGMLNIPAGYEGPVKDEVADAAEAAGKAVPSTKGAARTSDAAGAGKGTATKRKRRRSGARKAPAKAKTTTASGLPVDTPRTASATPATPAAPISEAPPAAALSSDT